MIKFLGKPQGNLQAGELHHEDHMVRTLPRQHETNEAALYHSIANFSGEKTFMGRRVSCLYLSVENENGIG